MNAEFNGNYVKCQANISVFDYQDLYKLLKNLFKCTLVIVIFSA